jgi:hypothetical protein
MVIPVLLYGFPSMASLKTELLSERVRLAVKRKLQRIVAASFLAIWMGIMLKYPPHNATSITFELLVFLVLFGAILWLHFANRDHRA